MLDLSMSYVSNTETMYDYLIIKVKCRGFVYNGYVRLGGLSKVASLQL